MAAELGRADRPILGLNLENQTFQRLNSVTSFACFTPGSFAGFHLGGRHKPLTLSGRFVLPRPAHILAQGWLVIQR